MREDILQRFTANVARARNLVTLYRRGAGEGQGRRPVHSTDILRSAVVLLHASLENVFRGVAAWKLPTAPEALLNEVPLIGSPDVGRADKFLLGKLAAHRAKTVQHLIEESVEAYLTSFTVNSTTDIAGFCRKIGVDVLTINTEFAALTDMIARRHHIVHQADRNAQPGRGNHPARSLSVKRVEVWIESVESFIPAFLNQVPD